MPGIAIISPEEQYLSPIATAELVGRRKELEIIQAAVQDAPGLYTIYITGRGGIGKTRLLQHILQTLSSNSSLLVASRPVDMYHTYAHTVEGFIHAVQEVLDPYGKYFKKYLKTREALLKAVGTIPWQQIQDQMTQAFLTDLQSVTQERRVVIGIDTVERLFPGDDPVAQRLGISTATRALVYEWLLQELLPQATNLVVILAGRSAAESVTADLQQRGHCITIPLSGLSEEESLEYFETLIPALEASAASRYHFVANHIRNWNQDFRKMLFHSLRDEDGTVRPILLALAIEYLAISGHPFLTDYSLNEVRSFSAERREEVRRALLSGVRTVIAQTIHSANEIIDVMRWLHKGANEDLLSHLTGLDKAEVASACEEIRRLSFVKTRPADQRLFLHDEMYALLRDPRGAIPDGLYRPLQEYYRREVNRIQEEIAELCKRFEETFLEELPTRAHRWRDILTEDLHYELRWNARGGFNKYFRYAEDALALGDGTLDMLLRAELMDFWRERDPENGAEAVDGLSKAEVLADASLRWVRRLISYEQYQKAAEVIGHLRGTGANLLDGLGEVARAELDIAEALLHILQGKIDEGERLLRQAEQSLGQLPVYDEHALRIYALKGQLYNTWGYLRRVQGQFIAAAEMYWKALPYWRETKIEGEHANTLTNLAFVLALRGQFAPARLHAEDALNLRIKQGIPSRVALSLTTLAGIEIYAGQFAAAQTYASQALQIAQRYEFRRGEGIAHTFLAACYRFMSESPALLSEERKQLLEKSLHHGQEAVKIFSELEEPERLATAYYEQGVTHREFCRFQIPNSHAQNAENSLQTAMEIAQKSNLWTIYLDAAMGLAWLYHYADQKDKLEEHIQRMKQEVQERFPSYLITPTHFPEVKEDTILGIFQQLARLHTLQGVRAMEAFNRSDKRPPYEPLKDAAKEFALALEYDHLVADDFRDLRRALYLIHTQLKGLNSQELKAVYDAIGELAAGFTHKSRSEDWYFWSILEELFGPYTTFETL